MILDVVALIAILYAFFVGYSRGIIKTVFALVSLIVALVVTLNLSGILIDFLQDNFTGNPFLLLVIGIAMTFILTLAIIRFVGNRLEKLFEAVKLNFINKIVGGAIMACIAMALVAHTYWFLGETNLIKEHTKQSSMSYAMLEPIPDMTKGVIKTVAPYVEESWSRLMESINSIKEKTDTQSIGKEF